MIMTTKLGWRYLLALLAGAFTPLSFSPFNWWPLSLLTIALFYYCLQAVSSRTAAKLGFAFGCGLFGSGASWVYVSIHDYGYAAPPVAAFITVGFVAVLASYHACQCWLWSRYLNQHFPALSFAALWFFTECWRGWFLTGFPWLYLGYAHVTSPLSGLAPVVGVQGLSFVVVFLAAVTVQLVMNWRSRSLTARLLPALGLATLLLGSVAIKNVAWTHPLERAPLTVGLVQANIPQELKFNPGATQQGLNRYAELTAPLWQNDIVLWSETAIPLAYQDYPDLVAALDAKARSHGAALITGIFYRSDNGTHNSIVALGSGSGTWHKQKLVPFGEYTPLREWLSNLLQLFSLPLSSITPGPAVQPLLQVQGLTIAPYICYEVVYPDFVRTTGRQAALLLTISNDTWFGASIGPLQHLQMAAMRARELGRYMIRATNNGVTALIAPTGEIFAQSPQFQATTLQGDVLAYEGETPFAQVGSWPLWILSLLTLTTNLILVWKARNRTP
jgi:apolipoprotein N-acyltransferase